MTGINFKPLDEATFNNFKDRTVRNKNTQYWIDRNFRAVKEGEKKADEFLRDMQKVYEKSLADLQKEIEAFYGRYATENGLTLAEVNKRLDKKQLKSAIEEIKRYYDFADPAKIGADMSREYRDELRRLSARAYMSRLEEIKARLKHEMVKLAAEQEAALTKKLKEVYEESHAEASYNIDYERGFSEGYSAPNNDVLEKVVKEKWLEDNYSSRIWKDKGRLLTSIETELLSGIAQGHNPKKIAEAMAKKYEQNYKNCERVARTETIHTMNVATSSAYKAHGIEKYEYVCDLSERTCAVCGALDGSVHDLKYKQEGVNYPVMHPNCRCTTIPHFEKDEIDAMFDEDTRLAYDENHKRYEVSASMTYREWKEGKYKGKIYGKNTDNEKRSNILERNVDIKIEKVENEICGIKKAKTMTFKEADSGKVNPNFKLRTPTAENCQSCVVGFKARLDGFNVRAKPFDEANEIMTALSENTSLAWIDKETLAFPKYIKPKENYMPRLLAWFDNNLEEGKYYTIEFYWREFMDGHIRLIFKENKSVIMYDPQSNESFQNKSLEEELYLIRRNSIKLINISDCFLNKSVVESVLEAQK